MTRAALLVQLVLQLAAISALPIVATMIVAIPIAAAPITEDPIAGAPLQPPAATPPAGAPPAAEKARVPHPDEPEVALPTVIEPVPPLSPEEALSRFELEDGFRIECVAAEPLIISPVALTFDGDGRIWVVEMRSYMPDADGTGEGSPLGRILILDDTDDDGVVDDAKVFLDGLVLPRAIAIVKGGLLYCTPPSLIYVQNIDDRPGKQIIVDPDYARTGDNPEHRANGLLTALDNWIYNAKSDRRYRLFGDQWVVEKIRFRGQWGLAQDDEGRLYHNHNSTLLIGDRVGPGSLVRNPNFKTGAGTENLSCGNHVFPRITSDVNRGYREETLDETGRLRKVTACCGQTIYRGDNFPDEYRGNAFVPEPAAHLIKRIVLEQDEEGRTTARFPYTDREFLTSDDRRFRPVNMVTAPDGTLYVVDIYRGLIQHKHYLTDYLRARLVSKGLDMPTRQGRIYRILHEDRPRGPRPRLLSLPGREIVPHLAHPNGWWRDTAQQILVMRGDDSLVPEIEAIAADTSRPLGQIHALWTLEGLDRLRAGIVGAACLGDDPRVLAQAVRVAESLAIRHDHPDYARDAALLLEVLRPLSDHADTRVTAQLALCLGRFGAEFAAPAQDILLDILAARTGDAFYRAAAISGLSFREAEFLSRVRERGTDDADLIRELETAAAKAVGNADLAGKPRHRELARLDIDWDSVTELPRESPPSNAARSPEQLYATTCMSCHMDDGYGAPYLAPPLVGSEWVRGPAEVLARIALAGVRGPITVGDRVYSTPDYPDHMPGLADSRGLSDEDLADVLTYVRRTFGERNDAVDAALVARVRADVADRTTEYSAAELAPLLLRTPRDLRARRAQPEAIPAEQNAIVLVFLVIGLAGLAASVASSIHHRRAA